MFALFSTLFSLLFLDPLKSVFGSRPQTQSATQSSASEDQSHDDTHMDSSAEVDPPTVTVKVFDTGADHDSHADQSTHDGGSTQNTAMTKTHTDHGTTDADHGTHDSGSTQNAAMTKTHTDHGGTDPAKDTDQAKGVDHGDQMDHDGQAHQGGHMDHGTTDVALPPPGKDASPEEIATYLDALAAMNEVHVHDATSSLAGEHTAAMDLVPRGDADNVAIDSGDWFDPSIWSTGKVPSDGENVLIPEGTTVEYGSISDAELFTIRVDGKLEFATDTDSKMMFDTMVVSPTGHLEIGTVDDPVAAGVDVDLVIVNNGPIDTDWDPMLLSRGLISHGKADIHGAAKDSHEKVVDDPMAGDDHVTFAEIPEGWEVGDTIVIAGTHYDGYKWDNAIGGKRLYEPEDEIRVITAIDGDSVFFDDPLVHDHDTPRDDLKTSVANYTRNVSIETEDPDTAEIFERGHVMFMHSDDVDVRYAEFKELGRTDKSEDSFDISDIDNVTSESNVQGRYSLHLHRTGMDDIDNPAIVEGNAVYGSPGWGYVHHDSNANLTNNASYDTFGAGFVSETGNETGVWDDNIAIFAQGIKWGNPKNAVDLDTFDVGNSGDGFWLQSRLIDVTDNIAASVNNGFAYFHRDGDNRMINADPETFAYADVFNGQPTTGDDVPILVSSGNEVFAAHQGLIVVKANTDQGHDIWSRIDDFTGWNVQNGIQLEYTSHYIVSDADIIGKESTQFSDAETGVFIGNNTSDIVINGIKIEGFERGIDLSREQHGDLAGEPAESFKYTFVDPKFTDVETEFVNFKPALDKIIDSSTLSQTTPDLELTGPLTYKEGYTQPDDRIVEISGTKTDGFGQTTFPSGTDNYDLDFGEVLHILETDGYYSTSKGENYFLADIYLTDRATGEIYFETHPVYLDETVVLDKPWGLYTKAKDNGEQDLTETDGIAYAGEQPLGVIQKAVPWAHVDDKGAEDANVHVMSDQQFSAAAEEHVAHMIAQAGSNEASIWDVLTGGQGVLSEGPSHAMTDGEDATLETVDLI